MDTSYPGTPDTAVEQYWKLRPLRFTEVEWLELSRPVPWTSESATTLRVRLREPNNAEETLSLEFEGVTQLRLHTHGIMQVNELTIASLADRGWENERYSVETPAVEQLSFYCRRFSALLIHT